MGRPIGSKSKRPSPLKGKTYEELYGKEDGALRRQKCKDTHCSFYKGKKMPIEVRERMKANGKMGGYRKGAGNGRKGYYNELYCMSTWELAWMVYQLEHGKIVEQCKESFNYIMNEKNHKYTPDFIIDGVYYEIKNWHRPDTDFKLNQFPKDKKIILIEGNDNKIYLDYVKEKYGERFWEPLYHIKDPENKHKSLNDLREERWNFIETSDIDFSKRGWILQLSKSWNIQIGNVTKYVKTNYPEFYKTVYRVKCPIDA